MEARIALVVLVELVVDYKRLIWFHIQELETERAVCTSYKAVPSLFLSETEKTSRFGSESLEVY